jgi:hypothetical protein
MSERREEVRRTKSPGQKMSNETNALLALKNAWNGAIAASDRLRELAPAVQELPENTDVTSLDLETYRDAALAQSIASLALRGLIEELQPRPAPQSQEST